VLLQVADIPQLAEAEVDKIFDSDLLADEADLGPEDGTEVHGIKEGFSIPFPHEFHMKLTQEWLRVFRAYILVDLSPASGSRLCAALVQGARGVAVTRNSTHTKFLMETISKFVDRQNLVHVQAIPKPKAIIEYEAKKTILPKPAQIATAGGVPATIAEGPAAKSGTATAKAAAVSTKAGAVPLPAVPNPTIVAFGAVPL
jgi:hypothetical protein